MVLLYGVPIDSFFVCLCGQKGSSVSWRGRRTSCRGDHRKSTFYTTSLRFDAPFRKKWEGVSCWETLQSSRYITAFFFLGLTSTRICFSLLLFLEGTGKYGTFPYLSSMRRHEKTYILQKMHKKFKVRTHPVFSRTFPYPSGFLHVSSHQAPIFPLKPLCVSLAP